MSYHHCPIEPDDWSYGDDPPESAECQECHGTGWEDEDQGIACDSCNGSGFTDFGDEDDDEPDEWY